MPPKSSEGPQPESTSSAGPSAVHDFFTVPAPIKRLFDRFPLTTYPPTTYRCGLRPDGTRTSYMSLATQRARAMVDLHLTLNVSNGRYEICPARSRSSYTDLTQAYLKFVGIDFEVTPSNNHASPTGALPFLLPALPAGAPGPIPSHKLQKWAIEQVHCEEEQQLNLRFEVYASLLDHRLRNAWLYMLYLDNDNFEAVARRLYVVPATTNTIVRTALGIQLQQAARDELLKTSKYIDAADLEGDAKSAFEALSALLGEDEHFFGRSKPGLFDASAFAYTHLILDEGMGWKQNRLAQLLRENPNLVQHRERLLQFF